MQHRRVQSLGLKATAKVQIMTRQLEDALARQKGAFEHHDSEKYAAAVAMAEDARSGLASIPA